MELLTYKDKDFEYTYYLDKRGRKVFHGEYKDYHFNGNLCEHSFIYHGKLHGEYKCWGINGVIRCHFFHIDSEWHPYVEMNAQEKLLFQIKHPGFKFLHDV